MVKRRLAVLLRVGFLLGALFLSPRVGQAEVMKPAPSTTTSRRPNLLIITAEGLRPDRLGCYKEKEAIPTPAIDRLAADGHLFRRVLAPSPSSLPSLATLFTGQYPFQHGVWEDYY